MNDTPTDLDSGEVTDGEAAWAEEIERRIQEVESGNTETTSWDEARERIRQRLGPGAK